MSHAGAPLLWARSTIRGNWRATVFLAVFAGLASGAVLTAVEVARRTSSAYERYLQYADIADVSVAACPVGVTEESLATDGFDACFADENALEVSGIVSRLPGVAGVARIALSPVGVADPSLPNGWQGTLALSTIDAGPEYSIARPIVVDGRLPNPSAANEVAVNEELLRSASLDLGDTLGVGTITGTGLSQQESANFVPERRTQLAAIVGVVRLPRPSAGPVHERHRPPDRARSRPLPAAGLVEGLRRRCRGLQRCHRSVGYARNECRRSGCGD